MPTLAVQQQNSRSRTGATMDMTGHDKGGHDCLKPGLPHESTLENKGDHYEPQMNSF